MDPKRSQVGSLPPLGPKGKISQMTLDDGVEP